ncbi:protein LURP-one-related 15-like [Rhodamnia argentea]|uniref:Protein LURP-one-related 15-like n=1 Tax=Rhodamnia argentea TaxID=178133 RepID=A0A8B8Q5P7_9MYRT|nr:protein LURP-one-related 15-like [Rhodamnia argentea]
MAQPVGTILFAPQPVVGLQYCCPYPVDVAILKKVMHLSDGNFVVTDNNGNLIFKVKGALLTLHDRRVLIDASGNPVLTLRHKIMTAHSRWQAFRGESSDMRDLIFTAKTSAVIQLKTKLEVFLANNRNEQVGDFKVKGSWFDRSCVIYAGESSNIVAQMHEKTSIQSVQLGKDQFMVMVYPNIDYAFIVALIVILDEINGGD